MRITPKSELDLRITNLQLLLQQNNLDAALLLQNADLFYFTGSIQQGVLYVPSTGEPLYLVRKDFGRARMESGLKEISPLRSPKNIPDILSEYGYPMFCRLPCSIGSSRRSVAARWLTCRTWFARFARSNRIMNSKS
jgi:Xaa-Pro dipeptidase